MDSLQRNLSRLSFGYGTSAALAINRTLLAKLPYDPEKDFQMVALMGYQPNLLAVAPSLPVKSVQELIVYARNNPGKLSYGSSGSGTPEHFTEHVRKEAAKWAKVIKRSGAKVD